MSVLRWPKSGMSDELDAPQIKLTVESVTGTTADIIVSTPDGGRVILLLMPKDGTIPSVEAMKACINQEMLIDQHPDVFEAKILQLARGSSTQTLLFDYLRPDTPYKVLAYVDSTISDDKKGVSSKKGVPAKQYGTMTDDNFLSTSVELLTRSEDLGIPWDRYNIHIFDMVLHSFAEVINSLYCCCAVYRWNSKTRN
jgi:hypothetical protein